MRILVIGAGATGGYFGGRLAEAGRDVTFLVRGATAERLRKDGLRIVSPHGNATLQPKIVTAAQITGPYDLVILSVKSYGLEASLDDFARAVGPSTMILPFLNGMLHLDILTARFGEQPVLGGVCLIPAELGPAGEIVQLGPMQKIVYGDRTGGISDRVQRLDLTMKGCNFEARASAEIMQEMWEKWVQLASIGASNCLLRGSIGDIVAAGGSPLTLQMLAECSAIAAACGYPPRPTLTTQASAILTTAGSPLTASIYRDMSKGNPVEADQILGDLLARGRAHGVETPLLHAAFVSLSIYQAHLIK